MSARKHVHVALHGRHHLDAHRPGTGAAVPALSGEEIVARVPACAARRGSPSRTTRGCPAPT